MRMQTRSSLASSLGLKCRDSDLLLGVRYFWSAEATLKHSDGPKTYEAPLGAWRNSDSAISSDSDSFSLLVVRLESLASSKSNRT